MNENALIHAVMANNIHHLRELIRGGVDVNAVGDDGWTALHVATVRGFVECVKVCCVYCVCVGAVMQC